MSKMWDVVPSVPPKSAAKDLRSRLQTVRNKISTQMRLVEHDEISIGSAPRCARLSVNAFIIIGYLIHFFALDSHTKVNIDG